MFNEKFTCYLQVLLHRGIFTKSVINFIYIVYLLIYQLRNLTIWTTCNNETFPNIIKRQWRHWLMMFKLSNLSRLNGRIPRSLNFRVYPTGPDFSSIGNTRKDLWGPVLGKGTEKIEHLRWCKELSVRGSRKNFR